MNARWLLRLGIALAGATGITLALRILAPGHPRLTPIETISCPLAARPVLEVLVFWLYCLGLPTHELILPTIVVLGNAGIYSGIAYLLLRRRLGTPQQLGLPAICAILYWLIVLFVFDRDVLLEERWGMASPLYTTLTLPWSHWVYGAEMRFGVFGLLFGAANAATLFGILQAAVDLGERIANSE